MFENSAKKRFNKKNKERGIEEKTVPIVQVSVWKGMSPETKKKIVERIKRVFEDLGVPKKKQ